MIDLPNDYGVIFVSLAGLMALCSAINYVTEGLLSCFEMVAVLFCSTLLGASLGGLAWLFHNELPAQMKTDNGTALTLIAMCWLAVSCVTSWFAERRFSFGNLISTLVLLPFAMIFSAIRLAIAGIAATFAAALVGAALSALLGPPLPTCAGVSIAIAWVAVLISAYTSDWESESSYGVGGGGSYSAQEYSSPQNYGPDPYQQYQEQQRRDDETRRQQEEWRRQQEENQRRQEEAYRQQQLINGMASHHQNRGF